MLDKDKNTKEEKKVYPTVDTVPNLRTQKLKEKLDRIKRG
jgi:hypothetical protein